MKAVMEAPVAADAAAMRARVVFDMVMGWVVQRRVKPWQLDSERCNLYEEQCFCPIEMVTSCSIM